MKKTIFVGIGVVVMLIMTFVFVDRGVKRRNLNGDWAVVIETDAKNKAKKLLSAEEYSMFVNYKSSLLSIADNNDCNILVLNGKLTMGYTSFQCRFDGYEENKLLRLFGYGVKSGDGWAVNFDIRDENEVVIRSVTGEPYLKLVKIVY